MYNRTSDRFFYCYSPPLKDRLLDKGERFICVGLHEKTRKKFWLFERTVNLNEVLKEWGRQ